MVISTAAKNRPCNQTATNDGSLMKQTKKLAVFVIYFSFLDFLFRNDLRALWAVIVGHSMAGSMRDNGGRVHSGVGVSRWDCGRRRRKKRIELFEEVAWLERTFNGLRTAIAIAIGTYDYSLDASQTRGPHFLDLC